MQFENLVRSGLDYFSAHPYVTAALLVVVAVLAYFNFKIVLKAIFACMILAAIAYVVLFLVSLTSTGMDNTEKFLDNPSQTNERLR
jgi:heme A synthase